MGKYIWVRIIMYRNISYFLIADLDNRKKEVILSLVVQREEIKVKL